MRDRPAGCATDREVGVVAAVLVAGSEKAAAHRLGLAHSTVKHHLANVSAIVDPLGRILAITDHGSPGADAAVAFVQVKGMRTVYARVGDTFAWLCVALTGGAVSWGALIAADIV